MRATIPTMPTALWRVCDCSVHDNLSLCSSQNNLRSAQNQHSFVWHNERSAHSQRSHCAKHIVQAESGPIWTLLRHCTVGNMKEVLLSHALCTVGGRREANALHTVGGRRAANALAPTSAKPPPDQGQFNSSQRCLGLTWRCTDSTEPRNGSPQAYQRQVSPTQC